VSGATSESVTSDELKKFDVYKEAHKRAGEQLVLNVFPRKVIELNDLVKLGGAFDYANLSDVCSDQVLPAMPEQLNGGEQASFDGVVAKRAKGVDGETVISHTNVYAFVNGRVPVNARLTQLIEMIKPILRDAIEHMNQVKVWILLLIPRMEDGNNFGVSIQEEVLGEVRQIEDEAAQLLDQTSRYYLSRGKLVTKIARYPHVDDYRRAIVDLEEKQFINLRLTATEVRNHYATLHDLVVKNLDKIKIPRTSTAMESMY